MLKLIKRSVLFIIFLNLTACTYSPDSIKDAYKDMESGLSKDLQEPFDLSNKQRAMIDDYAKTLFQWHRHNKLPSYSQNFAIFAEQTQLQNPHTQTLVKLFTDFVKIPHAGQATHLTPKIVAFAKTLDNKQILQLEEYLKNENKIELLEIKNTSYAKDISEGVKGTFKYLKVPLNNKQLQIVHNYTQKFVDNRVNELKADEKWNQQVISLLKNKNLPDFDSRAAKLWNNQDMMLTGKDLKTQNRNILLYAKMMKAIVQTFTPQQRNELVKQLVSISNTLSEMANK